MDYSQILERYNNIVQSSDIMVLAIVLVIAGLAAFLGYRLTKLWAAVIGFMAGIMIGNWIVTRFLNNTLMQVLVEVIIGLLIGMLAFQIYMFGVFILCGGFGFMLSMMLLVQYVPDQNKLLLISTAAFVALGVLSVIFIKPVIILATGVHGGMVGGITLAKLFGFDGVTALYVFPAVFVCAGILVQFLTTRHYRLDRGGDRIKRY